MGLEALPDGTLLVTEYVTDSIVHMTMTGQEILDAPFPCTPSDTVNPESVLRLDDLLYVTDPEQGQLDVYDAVTCTYQESFDLSTNVVVATGITYQESTDHLLIVDPDFTGRPSKFREYTRQGTFVASHTIGSDFGRGVTFDATRCSYWLYTANNDRVTQLDMSFNSISFFRGPIFWGFQGGAGVAVVGGRLFVASPGSHRVMGFDIAEAVVQEGCNQIFGDGFESGDLSAWSAAGP